MVFAPWEDVSPRLFGVSFLHSGGLFSQSPRTRGGRFPLGRPVREKCLPPLDIFLSPRPSLQLNMCSVFKFPSPTTSPVTILLSKVTSTTLSYAYNLLTTYLCSLVLHDSLGESIQSVSNTVVNVTSRGVKEPAKNQDMIQAKARQLQKAGTAWIRRYGSLNCGFELMQHAWSRLQHVFSVGATRPNPQANIQRPKGRLPANWLNKHPVDCLVAEFGHYAPEQGLQQRDKILALVSA